MKTIIILSTLVFIFLLTFALVKSAQYISKKFAVKWRELEEWFRRDEDVK
jgi:hypothetical protein